MAMIAMMMPILPGKKDTWLAMMEQMTGDNKAKADAIRTGAGLHERSFFQETPAGDFVILTFEGDDPAAGFAKMMADLPPEFAAGAMEVHGLDMSAPPPPMPTLIYDSRR
ncbi:MAG: hypothetical protein P8N80_05040 [Planktomarina sp.]|nr:hypothetical protein [Planktomarina sp.]